MPFCFQAMTYTCTSDATTDLGMNESFAVSGAKIDTAYVTKQVNTPITPPFPGWGHEVVMNAQFEGDLSGGNTFYDPKAISALLIKRREEGKSTWDTLYSIPIDEAPDFTFVVYDPSARSGVTYEYAVVPVENGFETVMISASVKSEFKGLFIIDATGEKFSNASIDTQLSRNFAGTPIQTLGRKYPIMSRTGILNHDSGSITAAFIPFDETMCAFDFKDAARYRKEVIDFLSNGHNKIIKLHDGRAWLAGITPTINTATTSATKIVTSSFDFVEIGDILSPEDVRDCGVISQEGMYYAP